MKIVLFAVSAAFVATTPAAAQITESHWEPGHVDPNGVWIDGHRDYAKPADMAPLLSGAAAPALTRQEQAEADRRAHRQLQGIANERARLDAERERDEEQQKARRDKDAY